MPAFDRTEPAQQAPLDVDEAPSQRSLPVGAEVVHGGVDFRVWAPRRRRVSVALVDEDGSELSSHELAPDSDGGKYFSGRVAAAQGGSLYWFLLDDEVRGYADPASRRQPAGVHGPSEVVDWRTFAWTDRQWQGVSLRGQVLYELHVGTFTPEGTWTAAATKLEHLCELGVTLVEVMPVAEFQGKFGWGYDGAYWFAPTRLYGSPDEFRTFVDRAHGLGLGVILDVVYNHFGPVGNYLSAFSTHYVSRRHNTEWGEALNYDDECAESVRRFAASNAAHWIREYHLDGLRLDATQSLFDDSPQHHIVADITRAARQAGGDRTILVFAENERQEVRHVEPVARGGFGMDGLWNDDFHHACRVAATGHAEFYYADYAGSPQELLSAVRWGYLYQGQWNPRQGRRRGTSARRVDAPCFVNFLQNHDQVANSAKALRGHLLTSPGRHRALTALLLLAPQTPMLFMGQEFAASSPFLYFADHDVDIAKLVREGRWEFLRSFPRVASFDSGGGLPDPASRTSFEASKLDWNECVHHVESLHLHRDLLHLRKSDPVFARQDATMLQGAVIGPEALLLRWCDEDGDDRLLLLNLGRDLSWRPAAEPLLAPPTEHGWRLLWSSEDPRYGGSGSAALDAKAWTVAGHAANVLCPARSDSPTCGDQRVQA